MPLKSVLNRVFAANLSQAPKSEKKSTMVSGTDGIVKRMSEVETAAILRGILKEEELGTPQPRSKEDSLQ
ncbi:hypothetical protein [Ruegeria faecimaris]|uniref:hypothetical protein n=1 Tax=Ruegeria faecimaris TaxID=686389 RepID=UPI00249343F7|nr:hypothetical protein [Ruegeria faecimaris]